MSAAQKKEKKRKKKVCLKTDIKTSGAVSSSRKRLAEAMRPTRAAQRSVTQPSVDRHMVAACDVCRLDTLGLPRLAPSHREGR